MNLIIFCGDLRSCPWPLVSAVHVMEGKGDTYFLQLGDESEIEENIVVLKELVPSLCSVRMPHHRHEAIAEAPSWS